MSITHHFFLRRITAFLLENTYWRSSQDVSVAARLSTELFDKQGAGAWEVFGRYEGRLSQRRPFMPLQMFINRL